MVSYRQDPLAPILAGDDIIASERVNQKNNAVYPVVAVRTRWMDDQLKSLFAKDPTFTQVRDGPDTHPQVARLSVISHCLPMHCVENGLADHPVRGRHGRARLPAAVPVQLAGLRARHQAGPRLQGQEDHLGAYPIRARQAHWLWWHSIACLST